MNAGQITVNEEDLKVLLKTLQTYLTNMQRDWNMVRSGWSSLAMTWHDEQRATFEPYYNKMLAAFSDSERETEKYIAFLTDQLRIVEDRRQKLAGLR